MSEQLQHTAECAVHSPTCRPCSCELETRMRDTVEIARRNVAPIVARELATERLSAPPADDLVTRLRDHMNDVGSRRTAKINVKQAKSTTAVEFRCSDHNWVGTVPCPNCSSEFFTGRVFIGRDKT